MAAYLGYTLQIKTLFRGLPIMVSHAYDKKKIMANVENDNNDDTAIASAADGLFAVDGATHIYAVK